MASGRVAVRGVGGYIERSEKLGRDFDWAGSARATMTAIMGDLEAVVPRFHDVDLSKETYE